MVFNKAFLIGLFGVSFCLANISGIVLDTAGTTPISGAAVQLEKGGQTAITGANGHFTLIINTAILSGKSHILTKDLGAKISKNVMSITIMKQANIEVTAYNLVGKALTTIRKSFNAGTHSVTLPFLESGISLYKVKSGTSELLLKVNSVNRISTGFSLGNQDLPAKNVMTNIVNPFNDVLAVTKTGYLNYRCAQYNSDTSGLMIKMIPNAGDLTDVDGNVYQTVRIGNQIWMAENLRVTKYNDGTPIPFDTSRATWADATTPLYCFYNNTTNSKNIKKYGALYNWYVVNPANPKKIAPQGWHVPSDSEWDTLQDYLIRTGNNWDGTTSENKIAKSLSAKTDWVENVYEGTIGCKLTLNNRSGFSALPAGYRYDFGTFSFSDMGEDAQWWSATKTTITSCALKRDLSKNSRSLSRGSKEMFCGFSVRLLKD